MTRPLPTILERIVTQRRIRYGVEAGMPLVFPFSEGLSSLVSEGEEGKAKTFGDRQETRDKAKASIEGKETRSRRDKAKAFIEGKDRRAKRSVIAEVKMGSPRLGSLVGRVDPEKQAVLYRAHGASALSVVVEPDFFFGSWELLRVAKEASGLPAVAKDFVVSERQLDEAVDAGADVILLIAALYSAAELRDWACAARLRGLVPLVETHEPEEIERLRGPGSGTGEDGEWELVGINNRDLRTFSVDLERSIALRPSLPAGALAVAESGIASRADVERLAAAGFDAFLVGESLLLADDPAAKLEELAG